MLFFHLTDESRDFWDQRARCFRSAACQKARMGEGGSLAHGLECLATVEHVPEDSTECRGTNRHERDQGLTGQVAVHFGGIVAVLDQQEGKLETPPTWMGVASDRAPYFTRPVATSATGLHG